MPWGSLTEIAYGRFGWRPNDFWYDNGPMDFKATWRGVLAASGIDPDTERPYGKQLPHSLSRKLRRMADEMPDILDAGEQHGGADRPS